MTGSNGTVLKAPVRQPNGLTGGPEGGDTGRIGGDLTDELLTCLEVLWDELTFQTVAGAVIPGPDELHTALWQTVELVLVLVDEAATVYGSVGVLRQLVNDLQAKIAEKEGRLWTPTTLPTVNLPGPT